jgi:hypothetical protein
MHIQKLYSPFVITLCIAFAITGCYKSGGEINIKDAYETGAYLQFNQTRVTAAAPIRLIYADIATATASIKVKLNASGKPIDSVVIYTGTSTDRSTWKKIKAVAFKDSGTLSVNGTEIAAALGVPPSALAPGSSFTFYNEVVTTDRKRFSIANTAAAFEAETGYNMALRWYAFVFCTYDNSVFNGLFKVVTDDWQDFAAGETVSVSSPVAGDANKIQIIAYPSPSYGTNRKPIVLTVNPSTNGVTVPFQIYGDYPPDVDFGALGTGNVNSCTGTISLSLNHRQFSATGPNYGIRSLILKK